MGRPVIPPDAPSTFVTHMKSLIVLFLAAALPAVAAEKSATTAIANQTNWFKISGMHCNGCAGGIRSELRQTAGVADATVSFTNKLAMVAYDTNSVTPKQLIGVIKEAGYSAKVTKAP